MKSIDQTSFGAAGTASSSGFSRFRRLRGLIVTRQGIPQVEKAQTEAPGLRRLRKPKQQIGDLLVFVIPLRAVSIAGLVDIECPTSQRDADTLHRHRFHGQLSALSWPDRSILLSNQ